MFITTKMINVLFKKEKPRLSRWITAYVGERGPRYSYSNETVGFWLDTFAELFREKGITDITVDDVQMFVEHVGENYRNSRHQKEAAFGSIVSFFRFWRARGHKYLPSITGVDFEDFDRGLVERGER